MTSVISPQDYIRTFTKGKGKFTNAELKLYLDRFNYPGNNWRCNINVPRGSTVLHIGASTSYFFIPMVMSGVIQNLYIYDSHEVPPSSVLRYPIVYSSKFDSLPKFDVIYLSHICHYLTDEELIHLRCEIPLHLKPGGSIYIRDHNLDHEPMHITSLNMKQINVLMEPPQLVLWVNTLYSDNKLHKEVYKTIYLRRMSKLLDLLNLVKVKPTTYKTRHPLRCLTVKCIPSGQFNT